MNAESIARMIVGGARLTCASELEWTLDSDLDELCEAADLIRRELRGNKVDLCTIINGKSGRCGEDCKFCAQSVRHCTHIKEHAFLPVDDIVSAARANQEEGVDRFSIVTAGRALTDAEFELALEAFHRMSDELHIELCASLGLLRPEQFVQLREAGVVRYHCNIETSRRFFPSICTTHSFEEKIATIHNAREAGLQVCSGGIIGMGETFMDRIDMALTLAELCVDSIPINVLIPIPGTPLEKLERLEAPEILRTMAIFRFANPEANIRFAAGRELVSENGRGAFESGADSAITGNMLTTTGSTIASDREMLVRIGREVVER